MSRFPSLTVCPHLCCTLSSYHYRIVRLTSPNLNYVIITGALLLYASVILYIFPSTNEFLVTLFCQVRLAPGPVNQYEYSLFLCELTMYNNSCACGLRHLAISCAMVLLLPKCYESTSYSVNHCNGSKRKWYNMLGAPFVYYVHNDHCHI